MSTSQLGFGVGAVVAFVLVGPGFGTGALVNLDQTVLPHMAVPNSLFGLGPEIPRRALFTVIPALFSPLGGSALVMKLIMVALFGFGAAGVCRWLNTCSRFVAIGCAVLYVATPFLVTRLAVGHLGLIWAAAFLPHALLAWMDRRSTWDRTMRYATLCALGGHLSGSALLLCIPAVLIAQGLRRGAISVFWIAVPQALWLMPGWAIVHASNYAQPSSIDFATRLSGRLEIPRLIAGEGFFNPRAAARSFGPSLSAAIGALLIVFALYGAAVAARTASRRRVAALFSMVGIGLLISGVTFTSAGLRAWDWLTTNMFFNMWRESDRAFLVAWLPIVLAVGMAATDLARRFRSFDLAAMSIPLLLGMVLVGPNVWGVDHKLEAVALPSGWIEARAAIMSDPGTTLMLPPDQYLPVPWARNRTSHQLFGSFVGGDLIISSDAGSARGGSEIDPRMSATLKVIARWGFPTNTQIGVFLKAVGVKWIVVEESLGSRLFNSLSEERGLELVIDRPDIRLFRVSGVTLAGSLEGEVFADELWPGVISVSTGRRVFLARSGAGGWIRGTTMGIQTGPGHVVFEPGSHLLWYWPAIATQGTQLMLAGVYGVAVGVSRRRFSSEGDEQNGLHRRLEHG